MLALSLPALLLLGLEATPRLDTAATELLTNGGFEGTIGSQPVGWHILESQWASLSVTNTTWRNGASAGLIQTNANSTFQVYQTAPVVAGGEYEASGWVLDNDPNLEVLLRLAWYANTDGFGAPLSYLDSASTGEAASFQSLSTGRVTAPLGPPAATSARLYILVTTNTEDTAQVFLDDFSLLELSTPTPTATPTAAPTATPTPMPPSTPIPSPALTTTPEPTATPTTTASASPTPPATGTPSQTATPLPTPTPTPTQTPSQPGSLLITEVSPHPDFRPQRAYEFAELYNPGPGEANLAGWSLRDNYSADPLPSAIVAPLSYLVIAARAESFQAAFPDYGGPILEVADGALGNGLADKADMLELVSPAGEVADRVNWGSPNPAWPNYNAELWDPGLSPPRPGLTIARSVSGGTPKAREQWEQDQVPSPGQGPPSPTPTPTPALPTTTPEQGATPTPVPSETPTPTPPAATTPSPTPTPSPTWAPTATPTPASPARVVLNEILPRPSSIDWNQDGRVNSDDEWVELFSPEATPVDLAGWRLTDASGQRYTLPAGSRIEPQGFLGIFKAQSRLSLTDKGDTVSLFRPDGSLADAYTYQDAERDLSFARQPDGGSAWVRSASPTLSAPNRFEAPPSFSDLGPTLRRLMPLVEPIAQAKAEPHGSKVYIHGQVTAEPDLLGSRVTYLQDASGGIRAVMRHGGYPPLQLGDWVLAIGEVSQRWKESEVRVFQAYDYIVVGHGEEVTPRAVATGSVGEEIEGSLVAISGTLASEGRTTFLVDDDSGRLRVRIAEASGLDVSFLHKGDAARIVGIVREESAEPGESGYYLVPRYPGDVTLLARTAPETSAKTARPAKGERAQALPRTGGTPRAALLTIVGATGFATFACGLLLAHPRRQG